MGAFKNILVTITLLTQALALYVLFESRAFVKVDSIGVVGMMLFSSAALWVSFFNLGWVQNVTVTNIAKAIVGFISVAIFGGLGYFYVNYYDE